MADILHRGRSRYLDQKPLTRNDYRKPNDVRRDYVIVRETLQRPHRRHAHLSPARAPAVQQHRHKDAQKQQKWRQDFYNRREDRSIHVMKSSRNGVATLGHMKDLKAQRFLQNGIPRVRLEDQAVYTEYGVYGEHRIRSTRQDEGEFTIPRPKRIMTSQPRNDVTDAGEYDSGSRQNAPAVVENAVLGNDVTDEVVEVERKQVPVAPPPPPLPKTTEPAT